MDDIDDIRPGRGLSRQVAACVPRRIHHLRWGTDWREDGTVRFALWAPDCDRLSLDLSGTIRPLEPVADGWFEGRFEAKAGSSYAFVLPDGRRVPDPAARAQVADIHGPSQLVDPRAYRWKTRDWRGRPWEEAVIYELHVGTFTRGGSFAAAEAELPRLAALGFTAIELMPLVEFAGERGWGYDGALLYAPHHRYGPPDALKSLIDAAHALGLMVFLDVVYNHFGPEGNYLPHYASRFFHPDRHTPWGQAINYDAPAVRDFFIDNALFWLGEYRVDGLRLDAIDAIDANEEEPDDGHILAELARAVRSTFPERQVHLATEDNRNITRLHERQPDGRVDLYTAEWNDDFHHAAHVIATGETAGYYGDFRQDPHAQLARALAEGFVFQGQISRHHQSRPRGRPSSHLPPQAFVNFIQNHDQVGNRAFGERLLQLAEPAAVRALQAVLLLSPQIPLVFMGEELATARPFYFFCDVEAPLRDSVRDGRRKEFAAHPGFDGNVPREEAIPDPTALETFEGSRLVPDVPDGDDAAAFMRALLAARRQHVVPRLKGSTGHAGRVVAAGDGVVAVSWQLAGGSLALVANLCGFSRPVPPPEGEALFDWPGGTARALEAGLGMPAWSVVLTGSVRETASKRGR